MFFFSSRRRHTRFSRDWSSDVCSSDLSTQAAFFDYDGDGDLDMYLLNSSTLSERAAAPSVSRTVRNPKAGDRLSRNDRGHFVDVSAAAHIYAGVEGYGPGVVASDVNLDACP